MKTFPEMNAVWDAWGVARQTRPPAPPSKPRLAAPNYKVEIMVVAAKVTAPRRPKHKIAKTTPCKRPAGGRLRPVFVRTASASPDRHRRLPHRIKHRRQIELRAGALSTASSVPARRAPSSASATTPPPCAAPRGSSAIPSAITPEADQSAGEPPPEYCASPFAAAIGLPVDEDGRIHRTDERDRGDDGGNQRRPARLRAPHHEKTPAPRTATAPSASRKIGRHAGELVDQRRRQRRQDAGQQGRRRRFSAGRLRGAVSGDRVGQRSLPLFAECPPSSTTATGI